MSIIKSSLQLNNKNIKESIIDLACHRLSLDQVKLQKVTRCDTEQFISSIKTKLGEKFNFQSDSSYKTIEKELQKKTLTQKVIFFQKQFSDSNFGLRDYLNNSQLSSSDISAGKLLSDVLQNEVVNSLSQLKSTNLLTQLQPPPLNVSALNDSNIIFNTNANDNLKDLFPKSDPITRAAMILLLFVNTTMSNTMNGYLGNYNGIKNNMDTLTNTQKDMQEVTNFMNSNSGQSINVFAALYFSISGNKSEDLNGNTVITIPDSDPPVSITLTPAQVSAIDNFNISCPQFMSDLQTAYRQYNPDPNKDISVLAKLAVGDDPTEGSTGSGQSQVMQYFVNPANSAGYGIQGLSSQAIYSSSWTTSTNPAEPGTSSQPSSALYQKGKVDGSKDTFSQLTFTSASVSTFVGSNGTQGGGGVLGNINQAMTAGTTSNNTLQAEMNQLANSINVIWNTVGSNLIPNTKVQF